MWPQWLDIDRGQLENKAIFSIQEKNHELSYCHVFSTIQRPSMALASVIKVTPAQFEH